MKKTLRTGFLILCLLTTYMPIVAAPIKVNGTLHEITTETRNNRSLIKLRDLESLLNLQLEFYPEERSIKVRDKFDRGMVLWIDSTKVSVLNEYEESIKQIDVAPKLINNSTYLPIRVIADNFGYTVDFKDNVIILNTDTKRQAYVYTTNLKMTKEDYTYITAQALDYAKKYDPLYYGEEILNVCLSDSEPYGIYADNPIFKAYNEKRLDAAQTFNAIIYDLLAGNTSAKDRLPLAATKIQAVLDELDTLLTIFSNE